ncbi:MAG: hypothetical protein KGO52_16335 [Nitrospirota bacterium]|nr:hypothetical protein [Nitrospirota bacterium]
MSGSGKKPRTEWIYGATAGKVTEIGLEISADGTSVRFTQEMTNAYVQTTYPRSNKEPKVITRVPVTDADIPFIPNRAIESFDRLVAVDTGTRMIRGEQVSVTGVIEGEWNWEAGVAGLARAVRPKAPFCLEFLGVRKNQEQLGWLVALTELMKEPRYKRSESVGLIVDSDLGNHEAYNTRRLPIYLGRYLPPKVTLLYAFDKGNDNVSNFLLGLADSIAGQVFKKLEMGDLLWNENKICGDIFTGYRRISVRVT